MGLKNNILIKKKKECSHSTFDICLQAFFCSVCITVASVFLALWSLKHFSSTYVYAFYKV